MQDTRLHAADLYTGAHASALIDIPDRLPVPSATHPTTRSLWRQMRLRNARERRQFHRDRVALHSRLRAVILLDEAFRLDNYTGAPQRARRTTPTGHTPPPPADTSSTHIEAAPSTPTSLRPSDSSRTDGESAREPRDLPDRSLVSPDDLDAIVAAVARSQLTAIRTRSPSAYFQTLCAQARLAGPRAGTSLLYERFDRHKITNPAALADDLGASVWELGALLTALEATRTAPNAISGLLARPMPSYPSYVLSATVFLARALGDTGPDSLHHLASAALCPGLTRPADLRPTNDITSFTEKCNTLAIPLPSPETRHRFLADLRIDGSAEHDTDSQAQIVAAAALLFRLAELPTDKIRSLWPFPRPVTDEIVRALAAHSYDNGRMGKGSPLHAVLACDLATSPARLAEPLLTAREPPAPARAFPPLADTQPSPWAARDLHPDASGAPIHTVGEAIACIRNFRIDAGPWGVYPAYNGPLTLHVAPTAILVPDAIAAQRQGHSGLDPAVWLLHHYYVRSPVVTDRLETAARLWICMRDALSPGAERHRLLNPLREFLMTVMAYPREEHSATECSDETSALMWCHCLSTRPGLAIPLQRSLDCAQRVTLTDSLGSDDWCPAPSPEEDPSA